MSVGISHRQFIDVHDQPLSSPSPLSIDDDSHYSTAYVDPIQVEALAQQLALEQEGGQEEDEDGDEDMDIAEEEYIDDDQNNLQVEAASSDTNDKR